MRLCRHASPSRPNRDRTRSARTTKTEASYAQNPRPIKCRENYTPGSKSTSFSLDGWAGFSHLSTFGALTSTAPITFAGLGLAMSRRMFQGIRFWVDDNVPMRDRWIGDIEVSGILN